MARPFEKGGHEGTITMLTLPVAGQRIHREVAEAEFAINQALAKVAALMNTCAITRNLPGVGAATGHKTMLSLASLTNHLTQGAGDLARAHGDLRAINEALTVMMPDFDGNCPPATGEISTSVAA